jgi:hypothetical protein
MVTTLDQRPVDTSTLAPDHRLVLHNIGWNQYVTIGDTLGDRPNLF